MTNFNLNKETTMTNFNLNKETAMTNFNSNQEVPMETKAAVEAFLQGGGGCGVATTYSWEHVGLVNLDRFKAEVKEELLNALSCADEDQALYAYTHCSMFSFHEPCHMIDVAFVDSSTQGVEELASSGNTPVKQFVKNFAKKGLYEPAVYKLTADNIDSAVDWVCRIMNTVTTIAYEHMLLVSADKRRDYNCY